MVGLYWQIGRLILGRQESEGWGSKVIGRLAADLRAEVPGRRGLSQRNLDYMRTFRGPQEASKKLLLRTSARSTGHYARVVGSGQQTKGFYRNR